MKPLVLFSFACLTCAGSTAILLITPTATQAVIQVVTDQAGNCNYRASERASLTPLVHDVNPSLFSSSNSDARPGSQINGTSHIFVLGTRTAALASNGLRYSRALQANTTHYVGVTCGEDAAVTGSFQTQNPPLGQSAPEAPPFLSGAFGNYGWPSIDWQDSSKTYVDPMTGILIKRMTSPGWKARTYQNNAYARAFDLNSAWSNPSNAITWPSSGTVATYAGASSDPLFMAVDLSTIPEYGYGALRIGGWAPLTSVDDVLVRTYGSGTDGNAANRTILICLSNDSGNTCSSDEQSIVLPTSNRVGPSAPSAYPRAAWSDWAGTNFSGHDWGNVLTDVTTSGNTITNTGSQSAQYFSGSWGAGCKVLVNDTETYTVAAVVSGTTLTTVETMTTHSTAAVSFKSQCSGVRVRKQTGTGTIALATGFDVAVSNEFQMPFTGTRNLCSPVSVTVSVDAGGASAANRLARLCVAQMSDNRHVLFAFFSDNGETRLLSTFDSLAGFQYHSPDWTMHDGNIPASTTYSSGNVWSPSSGTRFYTSMNYGANHTTLMQVDYTGNFSEYTPGWVVGGAYADDHLRYTGLNWASNNNALDQLVAATGNPNYDSNKYVQRTFYGLTDDGKAIWLFVEQQDDPAILVLQDISNGLVSSVTDDITTYPRRFFGNHGVVLAAGRAITVANILGNKGVGPDRYLGGPFVLVPTQVKKGEFWSSDTSLTSDYADVCPTTIDPQWQAKGATGRNCILMRAKQPCSANAGAAELAKYRCSWDGSKSMIATLAPGDRFWLEANCTGSCSGSPETMRVITTPTSTGITGGVEFWALRGSERFANLGGGYGGASPSAHPNGWDATMIPPEARTVSTVWINSDGTSLPDTYSLGATHFDVGPGYSGPSNYTTVGAGSDIFTYGIRWDKTLASQVGQGEDHQFSDRGLFHGLATGGGSMESYISMRQVTAPPSEKRWFLDLRHMSPFGGVGQEVFSDVGPITASLVPGTTGVFKFTNYPGGTADGKIFPRLSFAGRYLLQDISSPTTGDQITDTTTFAFCVVYLANECRSGSTPGEVYTSVPRADMNGVNANVCIGGWYATTNPCVFTPFPMHAWGVQVDAFHNPGNDDYWRKLTMGFSGPGRQYQFGNVTATPDGTWAFMQGYWLDGKRNEILGIKLPPFPTADTINHADYIPIQINAGPGAGVAARVKFGYAENGPPSSFFCTSRGEACVTDTMVGPFAFAQSDSLTPAPCSTDSRQRRFDRSGCTLTIPAISGRVVYYQLERLDAAGHVVAVDNPQIVAAP